MRLNRLEEAAHWYRESLGAKPDHIPAHLTYGKLLSITVSPITFKHHTYPPTHTHTHHRKNVVTGQSVIKVMVSAVFSLSWCN